MLDEAGRVKILDFGLAQLSFWDEAAVELTTVGQLMGTLDYMAPEQAERCGSVDYRVDLYALGATLFRLLCGRAPLAATPNQSPLEKLQLLARHEAPRLDTLRPDAPAGLVELVAELLSRQPQDRPASAAHVAERLARFTGSADLGGLLTKAQTVQADRSERPAEQAVRDRFEPQLPASRGSSGSRRRWWWLAAAALPLLILAGVLIVLETQKGQLVIESEVADVRVKLLKDGEPVRDLEIQPGATLSRLRADQYKIVIDSPSDSLSIDKDQFVLRSGQTVVARISEKPAATVVIDPVRAAPDAVPRPIPIDEPLYDGQTLGHWLDTLHRDRSPDSIGRSLIAIRAMVTPNSAQRITQSLVNIMPTLDGNLRIPLTRDGDSVSSVDPNGFRILERANPGRAFFELLTEELERGDAAWSERILKSGFYARRVSTLEEAEPLVEWLEKNVFAESSDVSPAITEAAGWVFWRMLLDLHAREATEQRQVSMRRLLNNLETSPHVDLDFWLDWPTNREWPLELRSVVIGRAAKALAQSETPPALVAQAAMIVTGESQLALEIAPQLPETINVRLTELAEDQERMLARVEVSSSFRGLFVPRSIPRNITFSSGTSHASETLNLLGLAYVLPAGENLKTGIEAVINATSQESEMLREQFPPVPYYATRLGRTQMISLEWPSLKSMSPASRLPAAPGIADASPEDWMAYLIHSSASAIAERFALEPAP